MSGRRVIRGLLAVAAVSTAVAGVPALSAESHHRSWHYVPDAGQPGGAVVAIPVLVAERASGETFDGADGMYEAVPVSSRRVILRMDDAAAQTGATFPTGLIAERGGDVVWSRWTCFPDGTDVRIRGLRAGDALTVRVLAGHMWSVGPDTCTGNAVGGTIDMWS